MAFNAKYQRIEAQERYWENDCEAADTEFELTFCGENGTAERAGYYEYLLESAREAGVEL